MRKYSIANILETTNHRAKGLKLGSRGTGRTDMRYYWQHIVQWLHVCWDNSVHSSQIPVTLKLLAVERRKFKFGTWGDACSTDIRYRCPCGCQGHWGPVVHWLGFSGHNYAHNLQVSLLSSSRVPMSTDLLLFFLVLYILCFLCILSSYFTVLPLSFLFSHSYFLLSILNLFLFHSFCLEFFLSVFLLSVYLLSFCTFILTFFFFLFLSFTFHSFIAGLHPRVPLSVLLLFILSSLLCFLHLFLAFFLRCFVVFCLLHIRPPFFLN